MIREQIISRMHDIKKTQVKVCEDIGIEYSALNLFLNNKKGLWFERVQDVLYNIGLSAEGSIPSKSVQGIQKAAWMEIRIKKLGVASIAGEMGVSYGTLNGFINSKCGMTINKVERLMGILGICLIPIQHNDDRHIED